MGQSIGLHKETQGIMEHKAPSHSLHREKRRRVWYSVYALDRQLALQLGRPSAIHDEDCSVPLPARAGDAEIDWTGGPIEERSNNNPSTGDYFLAVIAFSRVVGHALRSLNGHGRNHLASEDLVVTKYLDSELMAWKQGLPESLRFDMGQEIEESSIFKRQVKPHAFHMISETYLSSVVSDHH